MATTREQREAAVVAYDGPTGVDGPTRRRWIEKGGDAPSVVLEEIANTLAQREAAAVERERERISAMATALADVAQLDEAMALSDEVRAACRGRESAARMIAATIRRPAPGEGEPHAYEPSCALCGSGCIAVDSVATGPRWDCIGCGAIVSMRAEAPRGGEGGE